MSGSFGSPHRSLTPGVAGSFPFSLSKCLKGHLKPIATQGHSSCSEWGQANKPRLEPTVLSCTGFCKTKSLGPQRLWQSHTIGLGVSALPLHPLLTALVFTALQTN